MTDKEKKLLDRYIMHDIIHKLYHEQHKSLRWIADHLKINFRTVKSFLTWAQVSFKSTPRI